MHTKPQKIVHQETFPIQWNQLGEEQPYEYIQNTMENCIKPISDHEHDECIWALSHEHIYTIGTSGNNQDISQSMPAPTLPVNRGGKITYHGPGQRIYYIMIRLKDRHLYVHDYLRILEQWVIQVLYYYGINGYTLTGKTGVWVMHQGYHHKIAAIGIRVSKWVTSHGLSFNVNPDLSYFHHINPCGFDIQSYGVTSLKDLHVHTTLQDIDQQFIHTCPFRTIIQSKLLI